MNTTKVLPRRCKTTTKEFLCVDIRIMHRQGQLRPNAFTVITDEADHAEIQLVAQSDQITIRHGIRLLAGYRELARQTVKLDKTPCNYGGQRSWFRCPGCDRRVAALYGEKLANSTSVKNRRFKCRSCHNLVYPSQRETWSERMHRKAEKISRRMGGRWGDKPKGMHWRTYNRLADEAKHFRDLWLYGE